MNVGWAPSKDERLLAVKGDGASFQEACERLGVSRSAAIGRYHRIKGTVFPSQAQRRARQAEETRRQRRIKSEREKVHAAILDAMEEAINNGMKRNDAIVSAAKAKCPIGLVAKRLQLSRQRVDKILRDYEVAFGNKSNHP
ncbi:hypothetical protein Nham_2397 [Nitrobacter hamburgensis X14]|uniref:GcrA cell cycle regulator n=1 Tax=Nitrobacter hamburgensis (strain DSM 10229 / NCIMB 13809 / X14) TaxID=323097 RepID=Q1QKQ9_NITHX|nr:hypothetical protein [Nitrobacter hamburgensis]ABE63188.1 hypothetical protein Nham_2397 [Nitrobacter hamburgensis X14]